MRAFFIKIGLIFITQLLIFSTLQAEYLFKMRAREHFDTVWIYPPSGAQTYVFNGIGPNINIWLENPYHFSFGLSYSVMFINNYPVTDVIEFGKNMNITKIGLESKYYFYPGEGGLFGRVGVSNNSLNTKSTEGSLNGLGGYLGLGWEIKFSKIGLALEVAGRRMEFDNSLRIDSYSPSIGVHFYGYI